MLRGEYLKKILDFIYFCTCLQRLYTDLHLSEVSVDVFCVVWYMQDFVFSLLFC